LALALAFGCSGTTRNSVNETEAAAGGSHGGTAGAVGGDSGGLGTGGSNGGGSFGTGGSSGSGSIGAGGSPFDGSVCAPGQKLCGGACVAPSPLVGCALTGCSACPGPPTANSHAVCFEGGCWFECDQHYQLLGAQCVPLGAEGGAGADAADAADASDAGPGDAGRCHPVTCPPCEVVGPYECCRSNGTCGCTWAPGGYCT